MEDSLDPRIGPIQLMGVFSARLQNMNAVGRPQHQIEALLMWKNNDEGELGGK